MTVIIATLGGPSLKGTIENLNRGSVVPQEVLVCIPAEESSKAADLFFPNVKLLVTNCRGQVAQRAIGFQNALHTIVMQLDDDMQLEFNCVKRLLNTLNKQGKGVAVAPLLIDLATGESIYKVPEKNKNLLKIYHWLMNGSDGYQPGKISKSGSAIGIDPKNVENELFDVEWLAGGCVMHYKDNLVLENFYPFEGKAYCEDIIHAFHLKNRNIRLIVDSKARCGLENIASSSYRLRDFWKDITADFRARKHYMQLVSRGCLRMYLFYIVSCLSYVFKKIQRITG